jgi:acyl carrier protein
MIQETEVLEVIFKALNNLNDELDDSDKFEVNENTCLFGVDAELDSLSLVSVIVDVEGDISDLLGHSISLTDDRAMSQEISPFSNVKSLLAYIMVLAAEGA